MILSYERNKVPTFHELNVGEMAFNAADGISYTRLIDDSIVVVASSDTNLGHYRGLFEPTTELEYPRSNNPTDPESDSAHPGDYWHLGYEYVWLEGDLAGERGFKNDVMMYSALGWELLETDLDISGYVRTDGSSEMEGDLNLNGHKVINMDDGIDLEDGVNMKQYNALVTAVQNNYLPLDGSKSMQGVLNMALHKIIGVSDGVSMNDAINRGQLDDVIKDYLRTDGTNVMLADLDINNNNLINLAQGFAQTDGITVGQVNDLAQCINQTYMRIDGTSSILHDFSVSMHKVVNMRNGTGPTDAVNLRQLLRAQDYFYKKVEHEEESRGGDSAGKPVKLGPTGKLHTSFMEIKSFNYVGNWDPRIDEYPWPASDHEGGDFYSIDIPIDETYTWSTGNLAGKTAERGDALVFVRELPEETWDIIGIDLDASAYVKVDGSTPMQGHLSMGTHRILSVADGIDPTDAVNVGQIINLTDDFINTDGTVSMEAPLAMGGNKLINLADGSVATDAVTVRQLQAQRLTYVRVDGTIPMAAELNLDAHRVINMSPAVNPTDATNLNDLTDGLATKPTGDWVFDGTTLAITVG